MSPIDIGLEKFRASSKLAIGRFCEVRKMVYYGSGDYERVLAFKTPLPHERENKDTLKSLEVEAAILSRIMHPNIVSVIDYSRERERLGILMEYVSGWDLKRIVDNHTLIPPELLLVIAMRVAWALTGIHHLTDVGGKKLHVIHRDISLGNIMVTEWGEVKLVDFGSATSTDFPQDASDVLFRGRLNYLPPEYLMGEAVDYRLDLFSYGVVLYRLASGTFPFLGDDRSDLIQQMLHKKLERPSRINKKLTKREDEIIFRCLHPKPTKRFIDHLELIDMIQQSMKKRDLLERPGVLAYLLAHEK